MHEHDFFSREPDPIEAMLRPPAQPDSDTLRKSVYTQTMRVLRRGRLLRQFAFAASLLLSFAAGVGVMRITARTDSGDQVESEARRAGGVSPLIPPGHPGADAPRSPTPDDSALDAEWIAFDSTDRRSELYRKAGDRYINDEKDLQSALRCYSNSLDDGTEQDLAISPDDNWLLMAIKDARQKEKKHAKQGS
jgi:negative regulator of sigma E activity